MYVGINGKKELFINKYIHRIIPFELFVDMVKNNFVSLSSPLQWDDKYELWLYKQNYQYMGQNRSFGDLSEIYCQCWTFNRETDFMWRIYGSSTPSIKLTTKIEKLHDVFYKSGYQPIIGPIKYLQRNKFENYLNSKKSTREFFFLRLSKTGAFLKSKLFKPEREVRLFMVSKENQSKFLRIYGISPNEILTSVTIDPRSSADSQLQMRQVLREFGVNLPIKFSKAYNPPEGTFIVD